MIVSFKSKATEDLYHGISSRHALKISGSIWKAALRKLDSLEAAHRLEDLNVPLGSKLETLKGDLKGKHSVRINDQFRIVFGFADGNAHEVEITDYHS